MRRIFKCSFSHQGENCALVNFVNNFLSLLKMAAPVVWSILPVSDSVQFGAKYLHSLPAARPHLKEGKRERGFMTRRRADLPHEISASYVMILLLSQASRRLHRVLLCIFATGATICITARFRAITSRSNSEVISS